MKQIVVTIYDGLYYRLVPTDNLGVEHAAYIVHENRLEKTIADLMRGKSCLEK